MSSNNYPSLQRISILIDFCLDRFISKKEMIKFLDSLRHTLEELSPDLGVTEPHSGTVVIEK